VISRADDDRERHVHEELRPARGDHLGSGSLACPRCDAPVMLAAPTSPSARLRCPFCAHGAPLRDFLTLGEPTRPARVEVRVVLPAPAR
jgi:hypothetical protein